MPEEIKKRRGRPPKNKEQSPTVELNNINIETNNIDSAQTQTAPTSEQNAFFPNYAISVSSAVFGFDVWRHYTPEMIQNMVEHPMTYNEQLRRFSLKLYSSNGLLTQCIDYCTAMPTLDYVIIPQGSSPTKRKKNKELMVQTLRQIRHKEMARDDLFKDMVEGIAFYYFEVTEQKFSNKKTLSDFDVENILELNDLGLNCSLIPLPTNYTRVVGRKNSSPVLAFDLKYFDNLSANELDRKLRLYPQEIRDGYNKWHRKGTTDSNNWLVLDNTKTICTKVRSKIEERWGRPLVLAAIRDILYDDYFKNTCRNTLDNVNADLFVQYFPESKERGSCALTKTQQETQHNTVKNAIMNKNARNSTSFISVAAGTKIEHIERNVDILEEDKSSYLNDQIGLDLGFMANLLTGTGSGSYAAQQNNLELLLSEILMWLEQWTSELVKVINANVIKDKNNPVGLYYLPCSRITRQTFTENMKELYTQGKGSLRMWIASTGVDADAYLTMMDTELEEDIENKYPVHATSYTQSAKDSDGGRPTDDTSNNENTIISKANGANNLPSPSAN